MYVYKEPDLPDTREFTNITSRVLSEELLAMDNMVKDDRYFHGAQR